MAKKYPSASGFSLVELAIVVVILGLLTGGILAGRSLIRASELRSILTEIDKYKVAGMAFRSKYFALPGDMANATKFWGSVTASGGTCPTSAGTGTETCDGNGDRILAVNSGHRLERYRFYEHLQNAGLLEGNLTGTAGPSPGLDGERHDVPGTNVPLSRYQDMPMSVNYVERETTPGTYYTLNTGHYLVYARCCRADYNVIDWQDDRMIHAEDMWTLDTKADDGKPDYGRIQIQRGYWSGCATTHTSPAEYALNAGKKQCKPFFALGY